MYFKQTKNFLRLQTTLIKLVSTSPKNIWRLFLIECFIKKKKYLDRLRSPEVFPTSDVCPFTEKEWMPVLEGFQETAIVLEMSGSRLLLR